jgi:hypothetical protein
MVECPLLKPEVREGTEHLSEQSVHRFHAVRNRPDSGDLVSGMMKRRED